jgi:hypothetical protein
MLSQTLATVSNNGKAEHCAPSLSRDQLRMRMVELTVQLLIVRTSLADFWNEGFKDVWNWLTELPLSVVEITSARQHLQNAISYCRQEEFGAATFELRALRGQLQRL